MGIKLDLTGQRFGRLTAIKELPERQQGGVVWLCQCDCGNECKIPASRLKNGHTKSCGCLQRAHIQSLNYKDITNTRFGKLVAMYPTNNRTTTGSIIWACQCDCGNNYEVGAVSLLSGNTQSCGCLKSAGEQRIFNLLTNNHILFLHDKSVFKDLLNASSTPLRYDFIILDENQTPIRLIEFDGEQHFKPINGFGGEERFLQQQENDRVKNQYALQHRIPLVRIPYKLRDTCTINDILEDHYLVTEEL